VGIERMNLIEAEKKAKDTTMENHPKEFELLATMLNLYTNGFSLLPNLDSKIGDTHWVWLFLITRSFLSIRCAIQLMTKAYYAQAIALLRIVTEAYFLCGNCEKNKTIIDALLHNKPKIFRYEDLAKAMDASPIYEDDYKFACNYSHTSALSLGVMAIEINAGNRVLKPIPLYDKVSFIACCALSFKGALLMADFLERLLDSVSKTKVKMWRSEAKTGVQQIKEWLGELKERYGGHEGHG
jgi:hypothetical protein